MKTVADLKKGETKNVKSFKDSELAVKLLAMGCLPGVTVSLLHVAPLGCPICISIGGNQYQLSIRMSEAKTIELE